jgi:proline utilization trans-activator
MNYALFLYNTAKFYLGAMMYLIDEPSFMNNIYELYDDPASKARTARHWYAQFLRIPAFRKAIASPRNAQFGPAGHQYALWAMIILPNWSTLPADTLDAIQALSLAAVYLQAVDMRIASFQLVRAPPKRYLSEQ